MFKKILFFSFPLAGHVNPQIGLCEALGEKGVEMVFYTTAEHFHKLEHIRNLELRPYPEPFRQYFNEIGEKRKIHHRMLTMLSTFYRDAELLIDFTIQQMEQEQPCVVVCDQFAIWGRAAARYCGVPVCKFFSSILADEIVYETDPYFKNAIAYMILTQGIRMFDIMGVIRRVNRRYGKPIVENISQVMARGDGLCLVMTSRIFHPGGEKYPENVLFLGADHQKTLPPPVRKDKIFISLGTVSLRPHFFRDCIEATKHFGYEYVITLAGNKRHNIDDLESYSNVTVYDNLNFEDYRRVVNESALFISHGGFNGVTTALLYETPLLICPVSPEQINTAKLITKYRCGAGYSKKKIDRQEMRRLADSIVGQPDVQENLKKQSRGLQEAMGYTGAAERMIQEYIKEDAR